MDKTSLQTSLNTLDVLLIVFGVFVAIGVVGESIVGFLHWQRGNALAALQTAENIGLQQKLHETERKADALVEKNTPRHLTDAEKATLLAELAAQPTGDLIIKAQASVPDSRAYSDEISEFLRDKLHWTVRVDNAVLMGPEITGTWITIQSSSRAPVAAVALHAALLKTNAQMRRLILVEPTIPTTSEIWLSIGAKQ